MALHDLLDGIDESDLAAQVPLTPQEIRLKGYHRVAPIRALGPRYGSGFALYLLLLPPPISELLKRIINYLKLPHSSDLRISSILELFGDLLALDGDRMFGTAVKYFVGLERLGGYQSLVARDVSDIKKDISMWVEEDIDQSSPIAEGNVAVYEKFAEEAEEYLLMGSAPIEEYTSARDWVRNPAHWANSGSAFTDKVHLKDKDGIKVNGAHSSKWVRGSKWLAGLALPPIDVYWELFDTEHDVSNVAEKIETNKIRGVINSAYSTYLQMSYIDGWLSPQLRQHPYNILHTTSEDAVGRWITLMFLPLLQSYLSLDLSKFDHQVPRALIRACLLAIQRLIIRRRGNRDLLRVIGCLREKFSKPGLALYSSEGEVTQFKVQHGLLSGWRWTSLFGTIITGVLILSIKKSLAVHLPDAVVSFLTSGDDILVRCRSEMIATAVLKEVERRGWKVKHKQTSNSVVHGEFLRKRVSFGKVEGYPARTLHGILWRKVLSGPRVPREMKVFETFTTWMGALGRGLDEAAVTTHMIRDMCGCYHLKKREVLQLLATPRAYGGFGFIPYTGGVGRKVIPEIKKVTSHVGSPLLGLADLPVPDQLDRQHIEEEFALTVIPADHLEFDKSPGFTRLVRLSTTIPFTPQTSRSPPLHVARVISDSPLEPSILKFYALRNRLDLLSPRLKPSSRGLMRHVHSHSSRAFFVDWLLGKLDFPPPTVPSLEKRYLKMIHVELAQHRVNTWLWSGRHMDHEAWAVLVHRLELTTKLAVTQGVHHIEP
jgi:hypothetical protein